MYVILFREWYQWLENVLYFEPYLAYFV